MSSRMQRLGWRVLLALLAVGSSVVLPACDWFKATDMIQRASPYLSSLSISPASVLCGQSYVISFRYDDPQDDVSLLLVTLQLTNSQILRSEQVFWNSASSGLDLSVGGRVNYTRSFACGTPGGTWQVTVQLEDRKGHTSNTLIGTVNLTAVGG